MKNIDTLPNAVGIEKDINGIVYAAPTKTVSDYTNLLNYEKDLYYPNGRWVNGLLRNSSGKTQRTLAEQSAIDAALPDASAGITEAAKLESPVDFKLDSTRRPNGIMIMSRDSPTKIFRGTSNTFRETEKGLILATNLPVYIKGDFNPHT